MNIVRSIRGLALVSLASLGLVSTAHAQNSVDVDIVIGNGGIAILNYYSAMDVSIDPTQLAELATSCTVDTGEAECDEGAAPGVIVATEGGGELNADFNLVVTSGGASNLDQVLLNLDDVWAVRSLGGTTAQTTVTVALGTGVLLTNTIDTIEVGDALVYSDTDTSPDATAVFNDTGLSAANAEHGGVQLELDLSGVTTSGTYSANAATYTIEITGT